MTTLSLTERPAVSKGPLLQVRGLTTVFGSDTAPVVAVDGVAFEVMPGESVGIIGESGSGKSATAFSLLRLIKPPGRILGGEVRFRDRNLLELSDKDMTRLRGREISMILQDPMASLNPVFRVGHQIREAVMLAEGLGRKDASLRALELLRLVRIPEPETRARQYPHQMSGGMRQRVVSAIALAGSPSLMIADEPTTSLDVTTQLQFLDLIAELQHRFGFSLIFISHDLGVISRVCDRIIVMYAGRIVEEGPVDQVMRSPLHPYTAGLLRSTPDMTSRVEVLESIPGQPPDAGAFPRGCRFSPRCPERMPVCESEYPPTISSPPATALPHRVACWLHHHGEGVVRGG